METTFLELQRHDPQMDMPDVLFDLERCIRSLLDAFGGLQKNELDVEPRMMVEISLDGRRYTVAIVESAQEADESHHRLSAREQDIVRLISKGFATKTIASVLGLKPCTVSTYTKRIYLKLNVNSRAEMVAKVLNKPSLFLHSLH